MKKTMTLTKKPKKTLILTKKKPKGRGTGKYA